MKKIILFAVALLAVSLAKADTEVLLDSIVTFDAEGTPNSKESYIYNETGVQTMFYKYFMQSGEWAVKEAYQVYFEYDGQGRPVRRNEKLNTSGGWILMFRTNYAYDEQGRLLTETRESLSAVGSTWSVSAIYTYQYGENDVVEQISYAFSTEEGYQTFVRNEEQSIDNTWVMDIFWTGYEAEGADGQIVYYFSEHEVVPPEAGIEEVVEGQKTKDRFAQRQKIMIDGQIYLMYEGKMYDVRGAEVR